MQTYIHTYIHTYVYTCIHTYQDANLPSLYSGEDLVYGMRGRFRT